MNKSLCFLIVTLCIVPIIRAQIIPNDSLQFQQLDEVVVSDTRFELKRQYSGKTVIRIGAKELEKSQGKTIAEVINMKSGIEIGGSRGRQGEVLGVFARGGRGRQVLVLLDGVRISDPSSFSQEYDLRLLSTANIESIEIIKGAASTLYGSNAATAVISIVSKQISDDAWSGKFQSSVGSNQTVEDQNFTLAEFTNSARIGGTINKIKYASTFSNRYSSGLSSLVTPANEEDIFAQTSFDLELGYEISKNFNFRFFGNQTKMRTDYDESFEMQDAPYQFISEQNRLGLRADYKYGASEIHLRGALTTYNSENISAFPGTFDGQNSILDLYNKYAYKDMLYTLVGLQYSLDKVELPESDDITMIDPYFNVVYLAPNGLNLSAGLRLNTHSEYGNHMVYNLNPSISFQSSKGYFKVLTSYASSYITPSLPQLYGAFGANLNLEPETNRTLEGGVEWSVSGAIRTSVLYFNRREDHVILFNNAQFLYLNAPGTLKAQGMEFELEWAINKKMRLDANYTFTERKGDTAIRIPKHKLNALLGYEIAEKTYVSFNYAYTGSRLDTDFSTFENKKLKPFSLAGIYLAHEILKGTLKASVNLDNMLNEKYTEVLGFTARGRNIRFGMHLDLK